MSITFAEYAETVLEMKERNGLQPRTLVRYRSMLPRINEAIGHIALSKIRPQHLNELYKNLAEEGVRGGSERAVLVVDLELELIKRKLSKNKFAQLTGLAPSTLRGAFNGKGVLVPTGIPAETVKLLKEYRAYYDGLILKNGGLDGGRWINTGYVFTKDNGEAINPDSITKWLSTFAEKYGLPNIHPHKFRHSMASLLIYNNVNIVEVSKRLGHAKTSTTTDIYSHLIKQADAEACDCIADNLLRKRA